VRKVLVIGNGGSGKSTFSVRLGAAVGVPVVHLDKHFWKANWVETPKDEWKKTVQNLSATDAWVMDGNYSGTLRERMMASDTIVYFNRSKILCLLGVFRRRISGKRVDSINGCPERIDFQFVKWIWNYPKANHPTIMKLLDEFSTTKEIITIKNRRSARRFIMEKIQARSSAEKCSS
jgi:adenylate kinase family enzyme